LAFAKTTYELLKKIRLIGAHYRSSGRDFLR
jgi:hypothetical protein